ncbi:MAG: hypothetical protein QXO16_00740 [Archaeoglobaceae archaeon]
MIYETLAVVAGFSIGFVATWKFVEIGIKKETREETPRVAKIAGITERVEKTPEQITKKPENLDELIKYISTKFMLAEVTLLTPEGLPIASNSSTVDEDTATAPEIIKIANALLRSDRIVIGGGENRILAIQISPDVILYAKVTREFSRAEIEKLKIEVNSLLEGLL